MSLEKLVSDLSNFKTKGETAYDKLDPQIENGVDFIPNTDAPGFTPKTDLESLYKKANSPVLAKPPGFVPASDGQFSSRWGSNFPTQYQSDFMTTPIANHISGYSPPSILSQTFTLSPPELQKPDFSSWMAFSAIGDNVTQFASLLPLVDRTSIFSTSETIGSVGTYITPEEYTISPQTTLNLPRESWRYSAEATNDVFKDSFSTLGLGSSQFTDTIDLFHRYEKSDFTNVPGVGSDNLFLNRSLGLGGSFRKAADPVNLTHPINLRPFGSNWKNAHEDLQYAFGYAGLKSVELNFGKTLGIGGIGLQTEASRNIADYYRLDRWFSTPQGDSFIEKQHSLQKMNPTIETKFYNEDSKFGVTGGFPAAGNQTVLPIFHPQRHAGGVLARYEHVLGLTGLNPEPDIQITGGSRLAYQSAAFSIDIKKVPSTVNTKSGLFNTVANFAIDTFNAVVDLVKAPIMIGLSNPNKYSPWTSAAPISTHLGHVAFGTPTAFVAVDTLIALHKKGGTFNKKTSQKGKLGDLKRHSTLKYGELVRDTKFDYTAGSLASPSEVRTYHESSDADVTGTLGSLFSERDKGKWISQDVGQQGKLNAVLKQDVGKDGIGVIKGNLKSDNVDKVNALRYPLDYKESPDNPGLKDFIKFRFKDVISNRFIIFRAILDGISDSITPEYGEEKYIGRPDKVYVYQGADRTVSFNFSIYPKTKQEFPILMNKLNHLIGLCYPSYTEQKMMVTPMIELTLGDMFVNTTGLLWGLSITVEDNSTWELDDGLQFPHYIKAACEFKYIGNNKLSSASVNHYNGLKYNPFPENMKGPSKLRDTSVPINMDIEPVHVPHKLKSFMIGGNPVSIENQDIA